MKIPEPINTIAAEIDSYHESIAEPPRPHMGCSQLGHHCDRWLWLSFRWAIQPTFPGRVLRLFRRGQNEEETIVRDLRAIGIDIRNTTASQARIDLGCHIGGSIDGIIHSGVPEAPTKKHIAEFKTHSKKSFDDLAKNGVENSKPVHYAQMQLYMMGTDIDRALYLAVCKDDDRIHTERVKYDESAAHKLLERGKRIVLSERIPEPISADPSWYQCKMCDAYNFCHYGDWSRHANCRTCAHSTALPSGDWRCEYHKADGIPVEYQRQGCGDHVIHFDVVPWKVMEADGINEVAFDIDGHRVRNGSPEQFVFSSKEIMANPQACCTNDNLIQQIRTQFDGRIVG